MHVFEENAENFPNWGDTCSFFSLSPPEERPNLTPAVRIKQRRDWLRVSGLGGYGQG